MRRLFLLVLAFVVGGCASRSSIYPSHPDHPSNRYDEMKEMFQEMVVKKNAELISKYYHPEFLLISNGKQMDYAETVRFHEAIYKTPIQYQVKFDSETGVSQDDRVAMRVFITTRRPNEPAREIEVVLIGQYKDGKIYRVWELTYPDWSKLPAFKN